MNLPEAYIFVLVLTALLFIPLGLAIRTLLAAKTHVILPILRLRMTDGRSHPLIHQHSVPDCSPEPSALRPVKQGGNHGNCR